MISYYIESKPAHKQLLDPKAVLDPSKEKDREAFLRRALKRCHFKEGQRVRMYGTRKKGTITQIVTRSEDVLWENNKLYFITVKWDDGEHNYCMPSQLTLKRVK